MPMPFHERELTFTNPDGTEFQVRGSGDQFHAVFETLDGYTVTKDPATGYYQYARMSDSGDELLPTGVNVNGAGPPRGLALQPGLRVPPAAAKQQAHMRAATGPQRRWEQRRQEKLAVLRDVSPLSRAAPAPPPAATVGTYVGLCLLIQFPDVAETITRQRGRRLLQPARLHRIRQQRVGARLLRRRLRRQAALHERGDGVLHGRPQPRVLHRPDDPVRSARAGADPRGAGPTSCAAGFDFCALSATARLRLRAERLLRREPRQQLVRGSLAARVDAGRTVRHRRRAAVRRLPDHRHGHAAHAAAPSATRTATWCATSPTSTTTAASPRRRQLLPDVLRRQRPQPGAGQRLPEERGRLDHGAATRDRAGTTATGRRGRATTSSSTNAARPEYFILENRQQSRARRGAARLGPGDLARRRRAAATATSR